MYRLEIQTIHQFMLDEGIDDAYCYQLLSVLYVKYIYSALGAHGHCFFIYGKYKWLQELWHDDIYKYMQPSHEGRSLLLVYYLDY